MLKALKIYLGGSIVRVYLVMPIAISLSVLVTLLLFFGWSGDVSFEELGVIMSTMGVPMTMIFIMLITTTNFSVSVYDKSNRKHFLVIPHSYKVFRRAYFGNYIGSLAASVIIVVITYLLSLTGLYSVEPLLIAIVLAYTPVLFGFNAMTELLPGQNVAVRSAVSVFLVIILFGVGAGLTTVMGATLLGLIICLAAAVVLNAVFVPLYLRKVERNW